MAQASDIGATASRYTGDAGIGGGSFGAFKLDVSQILDLAKYTMLYNKAEYDQRQKDADEKILELSKIAQLNLNDLRGKDREEVLKDYNSLIDYSREYASKPARTQQEKIAKTLEYQLKFNAVRDKYTSGKARAIKYMKELEDINNLPDNAGAKELYTKYLNETFDSTPVTELFGGVNKFKTGSLDIPPPDAMKVNMISIGGNENVEVEGSIYNPAVNNRKATAVMMGLHKLYPQKGSPEYDSLTPEQKKEADVQGTVQSTAKLWADSAANLNSVLQSKDDSGKLKYYTLDDKGEKVFNEDKFRTDNATNDIAIGALNALKGLTEYSKKKKAEVAAGVFDDKGLKYKAPQNISADDFNAGIIDLNSGNVKPEQLVQAGMYQQYKGDVFDKKVQETDNALQASTQAETARHNKATEGIQWGNLKLEKDKWDTSQTGGETIKNGAFERAKRIYSELESLTESNGVIPPNKIRQLNQEQLKYLGIETVTTSESGVSKSVFTPMVLSDDYAIQLENGNIKVMSKATKLDNGAYKGQWDNTKSTNVFNVATNILNEELQKAGAKELNSYMSIDLGTGGVTTNKSGGSNSQSGSSTKKRVYKGLDKNGNAIFVEE